MRRLSLNPNLIVILMMLLTGISASAYDYDFYSDELYYKILSEDDRTVQVVGAFHGGDIEIPRRLIYCSKTYTVTSIGGSAFSGWKSLTSVTIPNSVTSIGDEAFSNCSGLPSVTIPNSVTSIGDHAFAGCSGLTSVTIPNSVTSIGDSAFFFCWRLTSVTIPNSVTSLGNSVFSACERLTSVTIPNSVTSIGDLAFSDCRSLTSVTIPNSVTSIGDHAFSRCSSLTSVTIPNSVTSIEDHAFSECSSLTSVTIPNSVTSIEDHAFSECSSLTSMTIPNSVTSIGDYAFFYCCSLPSVTIPNSVTSIGYSAFSECSSLTSVTIPDSVTSIGGSAFYGCYKLENIIVDSKNANYSSIDGILYNKNATTLLFCPLPKTSVTIPNSVTSIGDDAFSKCFNLKAIYMQWVIPLACSVKFSDEVYKETVLYVPIGTMAAYEKVDPWRNFWNIEEMNFNGIDMIETDSDVSLHIYVNNGTLSINGIGSHESVTVYDMQGQIVYNGSSHTIDNLSQGLYIVKVGNQTIKISI